jgi:F-type H+-transporting ATPase subunit delta
MIEKTTLARPYAKAIFDIAKGSGNFSDWSQTLWLLVELAENVEVKRLLSNSTIPAETMATFFEEIFPRPLNEQEKNLLHILAVKRRLAVLPEIAGLYEKLCNEAEQVLPLQFVSVIPLTEAQIKEYSTLLGKRFGKTIQLENQIDPDLIGGFWIKAGDTVIDGSIRGRLEQLKETMGE